MASPSPTKRERITAFAQELGLDRISAGESLAFTGPTIEAEGET